mmetsp:Transcript_35199/g.52348  ORF Transcript_35199/g.52348 Transcript_35199/m.52348 type:complete len:147 (-) Transcript_35199:1025-1465(-)
MMLSLHGQAPRTLVTPRHFLLVFSRKHSTRPSRVDMFDLIASSNPTSGMLALSSRSDDRHSTPSTRQVDRLDRESTPSTKLHCISITCLATPIVKVYAWRGEMTDDPTQMARETHDKIAASIREENDKMYPSGPVRTVAVVQLFGQ